MFTNLFTTPKSKTTIALAATLWILATPAAVHAQAVTEVITDYNGYWKTAASGINPVKPDNSHNLLSFSYNGVRYSTGVSDATLVAHGDQFTPEIFHALPMQNFDGTITGNTKIGLGAMADGVYNGTAGAAPSRSLGKYLNDGINGLDMGTCVANLPAGTMYLSVSNLQAALIGDGVPDILVTQVADPSAKYDRYEFVDINGNRVGNSLDVVLTNITPVGNWVVDFFEATGPSVLTSGYTQTQRAIRLWAADLSAFGINASNIGTIAYFKIGLSGDSDEAFVAYNTTSLTVQQILDLPGDMDGRLTRVSNRNEKKSMSIYPNPANTFMNVTHTSASGDERILVYSTDGILLMQSVVAKGSTVTKLNLPSLRPGSYHVVFVNGDTKVTQTVMVAA